MEVGRAEALVPLLRATFLRTIKQRTQGVPGVGALGMRLRGMEDGGWGGSSLGPRDAHYTPGGPPTEGVPGPAAWVVQSAQRVP